MRWKCRKIRKMIDRQEGWKLDHASLRALEDHTAHCASCEAYRIGRAKLQAFYLDWQKNTAQTEPPELPVGMNERLMAAIRKEALQSPQADVAGEQKGHGMFSRPVAWGKLAGVALAALFLVAGWRYFLLPLQSAEQAEYGRNADQQTAMSSTTANLAGGSESATDKDKKALYSSDIWTAYNGSFIEILPPGCQAEISNATITDGTTTDDRYGDTALPVKDCPAVMACLQNAADIRIFTRKVAEQQTLILAAYPAEDIQQQLENLKLALTPCITSVRIEIIKIDEVTTIVDQFSAGLLDQSISAELRGDHSLSWILILMGA